MYWLLSLSSGLVCLNVVHGRLVARRNGSISRRNIYILSQMSVDEENGDRYLLVETPIDVSN